jgi:hypothetical protein
VVADKMRGVMQCVEQVIVKETLDASARGTLVKIRKARTAKMGMRKLQKTRPRTVVVKFAIELETPIGK